MRLLLVVIATAGAMAVSGFPAHSPTTTSVALHRATLHDLPSAPEVPPAASVTEQWSESASLVLFAAAMFGTALMVRRRRP